MKNKVRVVSCVILALLTAFTLYISSRPKVLTYHLILEEPYSDSTSLFVRPSDFEAQVRWLSEEGYTFLYAHEFWKPVRKGVIITFDDGYRDNFTEALPILEKYGGKGTVFVATDSIGNADKMSKEELLRMAQRGHMALGSHTASHCNILALSPAEQKQDLERSLQTLKDITGVAPKSIAWPYGYSNKSARKIAADLFKIGFRTEAPYSRGPYAVRRSNVTRDMGMGEFIKVVTK